MIRLITVIGVIVLIGVSPVYAQTLSLTLKGHGATQLRGDNRAGGPLRLDFDLGTPNHDFGGPGIGHGGREGHPGENAVAEGNLLIIAEDIVDNNNDDLVDDPDDEAHGGTMFFEFDEPTRIESIKLVDIQSSAESIISTFDDQDDLISEIEVDGLGNNSVQTITVQDDGVARLEIFMKHSGGVARVDTCVPFEE